MVDSALLSRPGSIENDFTPESDASLIFLKLFANEVLEAFDEYNIMMPLVMSRSASRQKSAQFPVMGRAAAAGLLPDNSGDITNILQDSAFMNRIKHAEKEVFVDGPLIAPSLITEFDELRASYDVRSMHATELGRGVAEEYDRRALLMVANGARSASLITAGGPDNDRSGIRRVDADFNTNGASAAATLFELQRLFDEKFVPRQDRHAVVSPQAYSALVQQTDLLNRDWVRGDNGDFADGTVFKVAGFQLHVSTHIPSTDLSGGNLSGCLNVYSGGGAPATQNGGGAVVAGHYENTVALAFHKSAIASLQMQGMSVESEYMIEYQSTLVLAKKICGLSWLRPEACAEITSV
jgi:hypothetical protein